MKDKLPRLEAVLEMGPSWDAHIGRWPRRGGPSTTASPSGQSPFSLLGAGVLGQTYSSSASGTRLAGVVFTDRVLEIEPLEENKAGLRYLP